MIRGGKKVTVLRRKREEKSKKVKFIFHLSRFVFQAGMRDESRRVEKTQWPMADRRVMGNGQLTRGPRLTPSFFIRDAPEIGVFVSNINSQEPWTLLIGWTSSSFLHTFSSISFFPQSLSVPI